jgi:hypothetical protein
MLSDYSLAVNNSYGGMLKYTGKYQIPQRIFVIDSAFKADLNFFVLIFRNEVA